MRFTTWPALTNAFMIFTVTALSSLIPAANATTAGQVTGVEIRIVYPTSEGEYDYCPGEESEVAWYLAANPGGYDLTGYLCDLFLVPVGPANTNYTLAQDVPILNSTRGEINSSGEITYPPESVPGLEYFVFMKSNIGEWQSDFFMFDSEYS